MTYTISCADPAMRDQTLAVLPQLADSLPAEWPATSTIIVDRAVVIAMHYGRSYVASNLVYVVPDEPTWEDWEAVMRLAPHVLVLDITTVHATA